MMRRPVIMDCDPGHDDAIALLLALANEELDLLGVTTVAGNQTIENTTRNALKVLELCGRADIPVAAGRSQPLFQTVSVGLAHGASGMDGPKLPEPSTKPLEISAAAFIAEVAEASSEPLTLIVTGPFTNIAVFLLAYPHLRSKIACISAMGGGVYQGNRAVLSEFNIWNDPEAAKIVFDSGIPISLYGLDVTHKALILKEEIPLFHNRQDKVSQFVADLLDFFSEGYLNSYGFADCPMHDSCAVAALIDPSLFTHFDTRFAVDIDGRHTRGAVTADLRPRACRALPDNGRIAMEVDRLRLLHLILDSAEKLGQQVREGSR